MGVEKVVLGSFLVPVLPSRIANSPALAAADRNRNFTLDAGDFDAIPAGYSGSMEVYNGISRYTAEQAAVVLTEASAPDTVNPQMREGYQRYLADLIMAKNRSSVAVSIVDHLPQNLTIGGWFVFRGIEAPSGTFASFSRLFQILFSGRPLIPNPGSALTGRAEFHISWWQRAILTQPLIEFSNDIISINQYFDRHYDSRRTVRCSGEDCPAINSVVLPEIRADFTITNTDQTEPVFGN